jgi:hypothetical protein
MLQFFDRWKWKIKVSFLNSIYSHRLFFRLVKTSLNQARVLNTISNDTQISKLHKLVDSKKLFQLRVEEIPTNQLKVDENECILSVIHYDFKLEEPFGVGSTIKVSDCELGVDIKKRCRLLFLEEKERHRAEVRSFSPH